jgi:pimeloyl-ACP methyl ester carboxylesterase
MITAHVHGEPTPDPPLVLLHAFPLDSSMWDGVLPGVRGLARVIAVDLPGFGASPAPAGEPSLDAVADAVLETAHGLGHDRVVLAGCSIGGYVALAAVRRAPQRVAGLGLVDTTAEADGEEARTNRERIAQAVLGEAGTRALLPMLDTLLGPTSHAERPDVVQAVTDLVRAADPLAVAWAQRAMAARPDSTALLPAVAVPAAVVVGDEDGVTGPDLARAMTAALPDAVLAILPRAGHLSPLERPEPVAAALASLLVRVRTA